MKKGKELYEMRLARGLFRLWIVAFVLWTIFWAATLDLSCVLSRGPWCEYRGPRIGIMVAMGMDTRGAVIVFVFPFIVLAIGAALVWAFRGFRTRT